MSFFFPGLQEFAKTCKDCIFIQAMTDESTVDTFQVLIKTEIISKNSAKRFVLVTGTMSRYCKTDYAKRQN